MLSEQENLVSVIVPFFNAADFLGEAIQSVFAQTYRCWELLLVDDGSTDRSSEVAREYARRFPAQVRYLQHPRRANRGACASRNLGVRHSQGQYIALLDSDDVWLPDKLTDQIAIICARPEVGMVYGATQYWRSWTDTPEDRQPDYAPELGVPTETVFEPPAVLTHFLQSKAPTPCPSDILLRSDVVKQVGGFEETFRGIYQLFEDQVFLAKVCLATPIFISSRCWDKYRLHESSCVAAANQAGYKYRVGLVYLKWLSRYLSERQVKNPELWQALRDKRCRYRAAAWRERLEIVRKSLARPAQALHLSAARRWLQ